MGAKAKRDGREGKAQRREGPANVHCCPVSPWRFSIASIAFVFCCAQATTIEAF
jgi:hypothetical protein